MQAKPAVILSLALATMFSVGCSRQESPPAAAAPAASTEQATAAAAPAPHATACELITAAEMSAILGGTVQASPGGNERPPAATECIYQSGAPMPSEDEMARGATAGPYAEVEVDWGGGDPEVLDTSAGLVNGASNLDAADPLKGLGDRAYKVTADQVFISTHGNLMMIRFMPRAGDVPAKARKIFETAQPRM